MAFSMFTLAVMAILIFGYAYATRYQVSVDPLGVTVKSLFRVRFIAFTDIAAIATMRGKGIDYWLFSPSGQCIAKIGGSVQDFESLRDDIEVGTRSKDVMVYDYETLSRWQERVNNPNDEWRKSEGPPLIRDRNRRLDVEMVIGGLLVAALVAYIHFYLR